jgi:hypothetical protein
LMTTRMCEYPRRVAYPGNSSDEPVFAMNVDIHFSYMASIEGSRAKRIKDMLPTLFADETNVFNCQKFAAMFVESPGGLLTYLQKMHESTCSTMGECSAPCEALTHKGCNIVEDARIRTKWDNLTCEQKCALCLRPRGAPAAAA